MVMSSLEAMLEKEKRIKIDKARHGGLQKNN